jgi:ADP-heptose:LPS heptosyltransferase
MGVTKIEPLSRFYAETREARKIVVVELGFLGDSLHTIPALWELQRHYPQAALHVLSSPVGCEVFHLVPCVTRTWPLVLDPAQRSWRQHWAVLRAMRREGYDLAFNFAGADRSVILTALTGARRRLAYPSSRWHFWSPWLIPNWVPRDVVNRDLPVYEQCRAILAACGFTLQPTQFNLHMPEAVTQWAIATVPEGAFHLSINASTFLKEWPLEHWIKLSHLLLRNPATELVATGSAQPREQERLQALAKAVNHPHLRLLPPGLSIAQLAAVVRRCRLHVGADSGVLHLAMALGVPTLSFFREYPDRFAWLPQGSQHRHLSVPCGCINQKNPACQPLGKAACLETILPAHIAALIQDNETRD